MASPSTAPAPPLLIVLPVSHFCEVARWALERVGVRYTLQAHAPGLHVPAVLRTGARGSTTPVLLFSDGRVLDDSSLIVKEADAVAARSGLARLFPPECAAEAEELCAGFQQLGVAARVLVYSHALSRSEIRRALAAPPVPRSERLLWHCTGLSFVTTLLVMKLSMNINSKNGEQALQTIKATFAAVSERLSDGRRYLCGDTFTAADLTFTALALPALGVPYGAIAPGERPFERGEKPGSLRLIEEELRSSAAGRFAVRVWAEERGVVVLQQPCKQ